MKLLIFPCGTLFLVKISEILIYWYNFAGKNLFVTSTPLVRKIMLRHCFSQQIPNFTPNTGMPQGERCFYFLLSIMAYGHRNLNF